MKRLFAFLLCFILALPALTGCGAAQGDAAPQDNVPAEATPAVPSRVMRKFNCRLRPNEVSRQ